MYSHFQVFHQGMDVVADVVGYFECTASYLNYFVALETTQIVPSLLWFDTVPTANTFIIINVPPQMYWL